MSGQHQGGWGDPVYGTNEQGEDVTASFGYGNLDGHTMLRSGHDLSPEDFRQSGNHDHYGSGNGPNDNGTQRDQYRGYGA